MLQQKITRSLLGSSGLPWTSIRTAVSGVCLCGSGLPKHQRQHSLGISGLHIQASQFSTFSSVRSAMQQTFSRGEPVSSFASQLRLSLVDKIRSITITTNISSTEAIVQSCFAARLSSSTTFPLFSPQFKNNSNNSNEVFFLFRDLSNKSSLFGGAYLRDKMHYQQLLSLKQNRRSYGGGSSRSSGWYSITPHQITWGIIGLNACVFLAWQYAKENYGMWLDL